MAALPFQYVAPPNVQRELAIGPTFGYPPVEAPWLEVCELREPVPVYARMTLDEGEAAAIQLALEQGIRIVCLDDRRGRRLARALELEVVGLLGLLTRAKRMRIIDTLRPYTEKLVAAGARYSPKLLRDVLANVESKDGGVIVYFLPAEYVANLRVDCRVAGFGGCFSGQNQGGRRRVENRKV